MIDRVLNYIFIAVFLILVTFAVIEKTSRHEHAPVDLSYRPVGGRSYGVEIKRLETRVKELEKEVQK